MHTNPSLLHVQGANAFTRMQPFLHCLQLESARADGDTAAVADAQSELNKLGGRASYQAASELTTSRHRTSKWVFSLLTKMNLRPNKGQKPLRVLEVQMAFFAHNSESVFSLTSVPEL